MVAIAADRCSACGVHLAADQRYCVECGQSRGASRLPPFAAAVVAEDSARYPAPLTSPPRGRGVSAWRAVPNATAFAAIGALLLAMGVGVLIGRSGGGSGQTGPERVQTVVLSGNGAALGAPTASPAPTTPAASTPAGKAAAASAAKKAAAAKVAPVAKKPVPKVVKVGSSGTGPGYQNHKFTGNFFGGGG